MESGILLHWKKESVSAEVKTFKEKEQKTNQNIDSEKEEEISSGITDFNVSIYQLQSAFYLNISGILISITLFIWEILSVSIKHKHSTKNSIFC
jgi:hypothetical protein